MGAMVASASGQAVSRMPVSVASRPSTVWKKNGRLTKARPWAVKVQVAAVIDSEKIGRRKTSIGIIGSASLLLPPHEQRAQHGRAGRARQAITTRRWPWAMPSMPKISRPKVAPDITAEITSNGRWVCVVCGR